MLRKIFLCVFSVMVFAMSGAHAIDARPNGECFVTDGLIAYSSGGQIGFDYAVLFDNGKSEIPDECKDDVNELVGILAKQKADIETVVLLGSADMPGGADLNAKLAQQRGNKIATMLNDNGINTCGYANEQGNNVVVLGQKCVNLSIGDAFMRSVGFSSKASDYGVRAVFMFVIYRNAQCTNDVIATLEKLVKNVSDSSVKTDLQTAQKYCNNDTVNKMLFQSQYNAIMSAINAAVEKYPDLANLVDGNISIKILVQNIENSRQSLASDASVWKTADGKFNVARLASDSIAGVVLGTAGGIITSNVVKKNQVKRGFDDVMCTVGGQSVADWGDEFRVGIR